MSRQILQDIIGDFKAEDFTRFFRSKNDKFQHPNQPLHYEDDNFGSGKKLEEITFEDGNLIVCSFEVKRPLSERSGKKAQYELGKRILRETQTDAGIFIFYDKSGLPERCSQSGNFRFSLIYANYLDRRRDWSTFRRFTYFVSKELTNKTFLQRIGDGDFSSLAKIKEAFSVEKVTKEFYEDIANWYFWAVEHCQFPKDAEVEENGRSIGRNVAVIRLITRMIFIWFMRERCLVPKNLFDEKNIQEILKSTDSDNSTYYQAVLQNLFFATLSTKREERQFRSEVRGHRGKNPDFGNQYVFRYHKLFTNPDKIKSYFNEIPFLNGGLFECLDEKETKPYRYIDGFTATKKHQSKVPNFLFFSGEKKADLNATYGTKGRNYKVRGLLNILSSFNFTIDENSPDDADIALDPELLGRVFENLLASFNPETSTTARKATGSYYTPREIVDYMVTESLKEYFKTHLVNVQDIDKKLETLFATASDKNPFNKTESKKLVELIEGVRIVDPAVGSGAFPMGALNKIVFILNKVDPGNELWKQAQLKAAEAIPDPQVRRNTKKQIEEFFKDKNADYGRKLYLIQKCIYGVDIQQIAVEIAKLRFFISLLVDEKIDKEKENWGIEPLPNLDFKIMQGNSLISEFLGIDFDNGQAKQEQVGMLFAEQEDNLIKEFEQKKIDFQNESDKDKKAKLKNEVEDLMIKIFETKVRKQKADYFRQLKAIEENKFLDGLSKRAREEHIAEEKQKLSQKTGFDLENIEQQLREFTSKNKTKPFFAWKLYFAEVFEKGGFDVVIANPPYIRQEVIDNKLALRQEFEIFNSVSDLYTYFYEKGLKILKKEGVLTFITSNKFLRARYGVFLRKYLQENTTIKSIINFGDQHIFEAITNTLIFIATKDKTENNIFYYSDMLAEPNKIKFSQKDLQESEWTISEPEVIELKRKIDKCGVPLKDWPISINRGLLTGYNEAYIIGEQTKNELIKKEPKDKDLIKPIIRGRDIDRYFHRRSDEHIIYIPWHFPLQNDPSITKSSKKAEKMFAQEHPIILGHLNQFKEKLLKRNQAETGVRYEWYAMQRYAADYIDDFKKEKIIWIELTNKNRFSYSKGEEYILAGAFLMTGESLKYLLAFLNSKLCLFYFSLICNSSGMATIQWKKFALEKVPIPQIGGNEQKPFIDLVDKILAITKDDDYLENSAKQAKIREYEKQIDQLVYKLYGLTADEIKIVEK